MKKFKKICVTAVSIALASAMAGCTPTIGSGTSIAMTIDDYDVPAGLFIYYTMQGYNEAVSLLSSQNDTDVKVKDVKNAQIDSLDSTDWIQNKAQEYCVDYVTIIKEFDAIGSELSQEDLDSCKNMAEYYHNQDSRLDKNGVSVDTMEKMAQMSYKEQAVFDYYYGFDGSEGCTEDELKDYFDENFARVKYVSISLLDNEGEKVSEDEERQLRKKAESYVKQVNNKRAELDKMHELDTVSDDYNEYLESLTTTAEGETTTTTTTTTTDTSETTTTTTTDPYANERLIQKNTTTSSDDSANDTTTEAVDETDAEKSSRLFNEFVFNDLPLGEAKVYDYDENTIYVIMRGDLRERMTEDDYWTEDYIDSLRSMRYYDTFVEFLDQKSSQLSVEKNSKAYRRYQPFKLTLENQTN
ncbi:MAG: hypothetical protein K2N27_01145 [Ruminococcus sp.]|nr:hypothetical protein [Ruminococcus sp.]